MARGVLLADFQITKLFGLYAILYIRALVLGGLGFKSLCLHLCLVWILFLLAGFVSICVHISIWETKDRGIMDRLLHIVCPYLTAWAFGNIGECDSLICIARPIFLQLELLWSNKSMSLKSSWDLLSSWVFWYLSISSMVKTLPANL